MENLLNEHEKKNLIGFIHPLVTDAHEFCNALPRKCNIKALSVDAQAIVRSSLIIFLHKEDKQYFVISGFENISFDISYIQDYSLHVLENMTDQEIVKFCWSNVFLSFMSTIDNQKFGDVFDLLKEFMPEETIKEVMGKNSISQKFFAKLTRVANSTLSTQRAAGAHEENFINERLSILDEALIHLGVNKND